jgi:hypothetical protein
MDRAIDGVARRRDGAIIVGSARLRHWSRATQTGNDRLCGALPATWSSGDKTGTGDRGTTNDVSESPGSRTEHRSSSRHTSPARPDPMARDAVIAEVGGIVASAFGLTTGGVVKSELKRSDNDRATRHHRPRLRWDDQQHAAHRTAASSWRTSAA